MNKDLDVLTMYVAGKIEEYRDDISMTQDELAMKVGLSRPSLVNMENGRQGISIKRIFDFSRILGVKPDQLLPSTEWYEANKGKKLRKVVTFELRND